MSENQTLVFPTIPLQLLPSPIQMIATQSSPLVRSIILQSILTSLFFLLLLPHPIGPNPIGPSFNIYPEFNHFSSPPQLPLIWATISPCLDYCSSLFTVFLALSCSSSVCSHTPARMIHSIKKTPRHTAVFLESYNDFPFHSERKPK